jgi:hypothetical protein
MRTGVRASILAIDVDVRGGRDTDDGEVYDRDGPPRAASASPSSGGRGRPGSGLTRRPDLQLVTARVYAHRTPADVRAPRSPSPGSASQGEDER